MLGKTVTRVAGSEPSVRRHASLVRGCEVAAVEAIGKHLVVEFQGGWALHVHLGMTGRWRHGPPTGTKGDGPARVVLETSGWCSRCEGAPTVDLDRTPAIRRSIERLGPDLIEPTVDLDDVIVRARAADPARTISSILLDQTIAAGIGNVHRNEVAFEAGVHPGRSLSSIDDDTLRWIFNRASLQLRANVGRRRTTTGDRRAGTQTHVYHRAGRACRRCGAAIRFTKAGDPARDTFWCPGCQPADP